MNLTEESQRGEHAELLLENKMFKEAFETLRAGLLTAIEDAPDIDKEGVYELKLMLRLLKDVKAHISNIANTGKLAKLQLVQEQKLSRLNKAGLKVYG